METRLKGLLIFVLVLGISNLLFISQTVAAGNQGQAAGKPRVISVLGTAKVDGKDVIVDVLLVVPAGQNANEAAREALRQQGARPFESASLGSDGFTLTGVVWDQFPVIQNYNPGSPKTADEPANLFGCGETALLNTHDTWDGVLTSFFDIDFGGTTDRCPSLVRECKGRQSFDGNNDVAWLKLPGNTIGVTWYGADEADMALNINFDWNCDCVDVPGSFDVQTVFLHENGHVVGLGHSDDEGSILQPFYDVANCNLGTDDEEGVTFLYDSAITGEVSGTVTDDATPIDGATVVLEGTNFSTTTASDGTYAISNVPDPVTYTVTASKNGFESSTKRETVNGVTTVNFALTATGGGGGGTTEGTVSVSSITYATEGGRSGDKHLLITVALEDDLGNAVAGASVSIDLFRDGGFAGSGTGTTGTGGTVTFTLKNAASGCYTSTATAVTAAGLTWDNVTPANEFCK
jgi:hypothetical protein